MTPSKIRLKTSKEGFLLINSNWYNNRDAFICCCVRRQIKDKPQNRELFNPPKGSKQEVRNWAGEVGPHIPGRARRVGEARIFLQPLLRRWRAAAEDDVKSPEAHVDRLTDCDARQAPTEVALQYSCTARPRGRCKGGVRIT